MTEEIARKISWNTEGARGMVKGTKAYLPLKEWATPMFFKTRPVPYM